jgi:predicted CopG family antitoxin
MYEKIMMSAISWSEEVYEMIMMSAISWSEEVYEMIMMSVMTSLSSHILLLTMI